jgi:hypothetical protein
MCVMAPSYAVEVVTKHYRSLSIEQIEHRLRYSTFVSLDHRYMYYEVPKAGCTSMKTLILSVEKLPNVAPFVGSHREVRRDMFIHERSQVKLPSLLDFEDRTQQEILTSPDFFRFTLVRNPYTRLQSAWQDKVRLCAPRYEGLYYGLKGALPTGRNPNSIISFSEFVRWVSAEDLSTGDHHWRRQTAHLFYPAFDFNVVGHLEQFNAVVAAFYGHIGLHGDLPPPMNESGPVTEFDEGLAQLVYALYKSDFDAFGYPAESWPRPRNGATEPRTIPEARYLDELIERNIVIGHLYEERDRLVERVRVRDPHYLERYRDKSFEHLFSNYIGPIEGWLDEPEAHLLYELAKSVQESCIVEVGSYRGKSTTALALGSIVGGQAPVYSVDPHEKFVGPFGGQFGPIDRGHYMQHMVELGLFHVVRLVNVSSEFVANRWPKPVGLLWIDGDHSYAAVARDFSVWKDKLGTGCHVVFDDASRPDTGPGRLVREIAAAGDFAIAEARGRVIWLKRNGGS